MTTIAAPAQRLNWPRIGAISGSLSLHLYALILLLAPPVALTLLPRHDDVIYTTWIDPPKPPPAIPDEPKPKVKPQPVTKHVETPPRVPTPPPVVDAPPNVMSTPAPVAPPASPTDIAPTETAPTALAYNRMTKVPYPIDAARRGEHGTVKLRVLVGTDGNPQAVEIEQSSGSRSLDQAARNAVTHWTFKPGTRNGAAYAAWASISIAFDLTQL